MIHLHREKIRGRPEQREFYRLANFQNWKAEHKSLNAGVESEYLSQLMLKFLEIKMFYLREMNE